MVRPLPRRGSCRDGRPQLASGDQPGQDPATRGTPDRAASVASPARTDPDRRPAGDAGLDRARGADPVPDQPFVAHRQGHRRTAAPLRTPPSRVADPCRRHQVRQHPRRRRAQVPRPPRQQVQRPRHRPPNRQARQQLPARHRHRIRAHRHRRPLPPRLRRDPLRREGRHRDRCAAAGRGMAGRPRRRHRTGAVGQRLGLQITCLARCLHRTGHHPQTHPPLPATNQRKDRTLPPHHGRGLGLRPAV